MDVAEYRMRVEALAARCIAELQRAHGDRVLETKCCVRYLKRGVALGFTTGELVDFLGVSTPSILDRAGFSDDEGQRVMDELSLLTDEEIASEAE